MSDALHNLCRADPVWAERYEGWTELGHGASATVVRTHGRALGEDLALKVFPHLSRDEWARFRREVSTAQKLTSPFIVRTYSPFPRGGFAWIELELVEGHTLRHELDSRAAGGRPFALREVVEIASAVAEALRAAHEAGVTHRDVKPANILLPRGGRPAAKLGDFGISRLAGAARLTSTGLLVGTPQFSAPEVAAGGRAEPPSDIYSFALCVYLMLSGGQPPFAVEDESVPTHWLRAHTEQRPRPISEFDAAVPARLAALLERALDKDPARRPTADEALAALRRLGEDEAAPVTPRRRRGSVVAGVAATSLAAAAALALWAHGGAASAPAAGPAPPVSASIGPEAARSAPVRTAAVAATVPAAPITRAAAGASAPARPSPWSVAPASAPAPAAPSPSTAPPGPDTAPSEAAFTQPAAPSPVREPASTPPEAPVEAALRARPVPPPAAEEPRAAKTGSAALHLEGLLRARPVAIGRHEGLPGQREMVLVDALHGEEWIWFRFRLDGGASLRIARVSWERGEITSYVQEPAGGDLRVIVQVPRAAVTRRARLQLEVDGGPAYTFALGSRSIGRFLKELFQ